MFDKWWLEDDGLGDRCMYSYAMPLRVLLFIFQRKGKEKKKRKNREGWEEQEPIHRLKRHQGYLFIIQQRRANFSHLTRLYHYLASSTKVSGK